ncbi:MAG TPA: hypothetical protein VFA27_13120 [Vicinamibacterales bacterium]|nr:hypothetical protein [Vicinamibacterales bacterium]
MTAQAEPKGMAVAELQSQLEIAAQDVRRAQEAARRAEERAALAERSAREAWAFVRALRGGRRISDTVDKA